MLWGKKCWVGDKRDEVMASSVVAGDCSEDGVWKWKLEVQETAMRLIEWRAAEAKGQGPESSGDSVSSFYSVFIEYWVCTTCHTLFKWWAHTRKMCWPSVTSCITHLTHSKQTWLVTAPLPHMGGVLQSCSPNLTGASQHDLPVKGLPKQILWEYPTFFPG